MEWFTSLIFFWEASKILSLLNAHMILVLTLERLVEEKSKYKDWLAFSKPLLIPRIGPKASVIGKFSSVSTPYWMQEKFA